MLRDKSGTFVGLSLSKRGHWLLIMNEVQTEALLYDLNLPDPSTTPIHLKVGLNQNGTWTYSFSLDETKLAICRFEIPAQSDPKTEVVATPPIASVTQWDLSSSKSIAEPRTVTLPESNGPVKKIEFLKDNQTLSIIDEQATLQRYDLSKPQPKIREFKLGEPKSPWKTVGFTRDAQWVVTTDESKGMARLWNAWADDPLAKPIDLKWLQLRDRPVGPRRARPLADCPEHGRAGDAALEPAGVPSRSASPSLAGFAVGGESRPDQYFRRHAERSLVDHRLD